MAATMEARAMSMAVGAASSTDWAGAVAMEAMDMALPTDTDAAAHHAMEDTGLLVSIE